jgi:Ca2+-binding EF-hand superfamily protein
MLEKEALQDEKRNPCAAFLMHDKKRCGYVSKGELAEILRRWNLSLSPQQNTWLERMMDVDGDGKMNYRAFCARIFDDGNTSDVAATKEATAEDGGAMLKQRVAQHFKHLQLAFLHYDIAHDSQISAKEV